MMAGIDEFSASARMNRYEKGIHEPNFGMMQHLAEVLGLPVAFFYCIEDDFADLLARTARLSPTNRAMIFDLARRLSDC